MAYLGFYVSFGGILKHVVDLQHASRGSGDAGVGMVCLKAAVEAGNEAR